MTAADHCELNEQFLCIHCKTQYCGPTRRQCPVLIGIEQPINGRKCEHFTNNVLYMESSSSCCGGVKTQHKIFGCVVKEKCQLGNVIRGVQWCKNCDAFQEKK